MAKRIEPFRDYSEHDVVNMFSLATSAYTIEDAKQGDGGDFDAGVVVKVSNTNVLPGDVHEHDTSYAAANDLRGYLGAEFANGHVGYQSYPYNPMTVEPADATDEAAIGITLRETLAFDENGEKMLYYKQKLDEAQAVLPGQTVPVLTRGLVILKVSDAFVKWDHDAAGGTDDQYGVTPGMDIYLAAGGKLTTDSAGTIKVGSVLSADKITAVGTDATKALCKLSF